MTDEINSSIKTPSPGHKLLLPHYSILRSRPAGAGEKAAPQGSGFATIKLCFKYAKIKSLVWLNGLYFPR